MLARMHAGLRDRIVLRGLEVHAVIGVHAHERAAPRLLRVDLEMACDTRAAAAGDRLADTLDYDAIARRLRELAAALQPALLETLTERMGELLMREFGVRALRLCIDKPGAVPGAAGAGVVIQRVAPGEAAAGPAATP